MKTLLTALLITFLALNVYSATPRGNHFSDCHPYGLNDRHSFKMTAYLDKGDFYSAFQMFKDKACNLPSLTVIYGSDFRVADMAGSLQEFDHTPTHVFMVLLDEEVVELYNDINSQKGCGIKDWKINIPRDVNGLFCHPSKMPTVGITLFDTIKYENKILQFGGIPYDWNISDSSNRPSQVHNIQFHQ